MKNKRLEYEDSTDHNQKIKKKVQQIIDYPRKLERKPSNKQIRSPRQKLIKININSQLEQKPSSTKLSTFLQNNDINKNNNNSIVQSICYLSPKPGKCTSGTQNQKSGMKTRENIHWGRGILQKQKNQISSTEILSPSSSNLIKRKSGNEQRRDSDNGNNDCSILNRNRQNNGQKQQMEDQLTRINTRNKELTLQNKNLLEQIEKLKESNANLTKDINQLKQTNQSIYKQTKQMTQNNFYLTKQIQKLTTLIKQQTLLKKQLQQNNTKIIKQKEQQITQIEQFKKNYKIHENIYNNYQILQRMYKKVKNQNQLLISKNKFFILQNQKLNQQISELSKLLDEIPLPAKKIRKRSKSKQFVYSSDKENFHSNNFISTPLTINTKRCRFEKQSRKDQNFFDLSPE